MVNGNAREWMSVIHVWISCRNCMGSWKGSFFTGKGRLMWYVSKTADMLSALSGITVTYLQPSEKCRRR